VKSGKGYRLKKGVAKNYRGKEGNPKIRLCQEAARGTWWNDNVILAGQRFVQTYKYEGEA